MPCDLSCPRAVCPILVHEDTGGGSGSHIRKYGFIFSSHYIISVETMMTFPFFSGEGTAFTAIQSPLLKFCKVDRQGYRFLSKKPLVPLVGRSKSLLTLLHNMAFLSRAEEPAFQVGFMGKKKKIPPNLAS